MNKSGITLNESIRLLRSDTRSMYDMRIVYSFYELSVNENRYYAVYVECGEESSFESIGESFQTAENIYSAVCEGFVSPLGLFDVIADIKNSEKY